MCYDYARDGVGRLSLPPASELRVPVRLLSVPSKYLGVPFTRFLLCPRPCSHARLRRAVLLTELDDRRVPVLRGNEHGCEAVVVGLVCVPAVLEKELDDRRVSALRGNPHGCEAVVSRPRVRCACSGGKP